MIYNVSLYLRDYFSYNGTIFRSKQLRSFQSGCNGYQGMFLFNEKIKKF